MAKNTASIIGAGKKEDRQIMDFYPTPSDVTIALMDFLALPKGSRIWECACGDGAMSKVMERYQMTVYSTDIRPTDYSQKQADFLDFVLNTDEMFDAIITNTPFNEAKKFILQALKGAPIVAMLLKSQYWHAADRLSLFKKHPPAWVLPLSWRPDFIKGGSPQMDVIWTIWLPNDTVTKYKPLSKPKNQLEIF